MLHVGLCCLWGCLILLALSTLLDAKLDNLSNYGKLRSGLNSGFLNIMIPKRLFSHFYGFGSLINAWIILMLLTLIGFPLGWSIVSWLIPNTVAFPIIDKVLACDAEPSVIDHSLVLDTLLCLVVFQFQLSRRLWESIYISTHGTGSVMHIAGYLVGMAHYSLVPVTLAVDVVPYIMCSTIAPRDLHIGGSVGDSFCLRHVFGLVLFFYASYHQHLGHVILARLRAPLSAASAAPRQQQHSVYAVPHGDWFSGASRGGWGVSLSSPHYFAEVLIYISIALLGNGFQAVVADLFPMVEERRLKVPRGAASLLMLVWVTCNLSVTAMKTHKWYHHKFDDYPAERWAIFPYLL